MRTAHSSGSVRHRPGGGLLLLLAGLTVVVSLPPLQAQPGAGGMRVVVTPGKIMDVAERITQMVEKPLQRFEKDRNEGDARKAFRLICDFNPDNQPNTTDKFGPCSDLADKLRDLQKNHGLQITAYVHGEVSGHVVLPVLACSEIVMSHNAQLGPILDPGKTLDPGKRLTYERFAKNRDYALALVHKMHDHDLIVVRVPGGRGRERFRDAAEKPTPRGEPVPDLGRGITASYDFKQCRDYGFCQKDACDDIRDVLDAYQLPHSALSQLPAEPVVWQMTLSGDLTARHAREGETAHQPGVGREKGQHPDFSAGVCRWRQFAGPAAGP